MSNIIRFPIERVKPVAVPFDLSERTRLEMHLDVIEDIVNGEVCAEDAETAMRLYCVAYKLDVNQFNLSWTYDEVHITLA